MNSAQMGRRSTSGSLALSGVFDGRVRSTPPDRSAEFGGVSGGLRQALQSGPGGKMLSVQQNRVFSPLIAVDDARL